MDSNKSNSDLLKCENEFFVNKSLNKSLLITKNAKKDVINSSVNTSFKTEKISSNVLNRAKDFLQKSKQDLNEVKSCDLVTNETNDCQSSGQTIEMNLLLFQNNDQLNSESESESSSESSTQDSDEETDDCEDRHSDKDCIQTNK